MPPIKSISSLFPLDLAPQGVFYVSNDPAIRIGVQVTDDTKMRVNRQRLRSWLATNISIHFGKTAVTFEGDRSLGPVTVRFADGTAAVGDIIAGADGVNSAGELLTSPYLPIVDLGLFLSHSSNVTQFEEISSIQSTSKILFVSFPSESWVASSPSATTTLSNNSSWVTRAT